MNHSKRLRGTWNFGSSSAPELQRVLLCVKRLEIILRGGQAGCVLGTPSILQMLKHSVAPHTHGGGASLSSGCVLIRFLCCNRKPSPGALNNDSNVFLTAWKIQDQGVSQVGAWRTHLALQTETFLAASSYSGEKKICVSSFLIKARTPSGWPS